MTKTEVLSFGVPEERYKEFQAAYNRDLNSRIKSEMRKEADPLIRSAILAMLELIKRPETLESILKYINKAYFSEV